MYRVEQVPSETHVWTLEPNFLTQTDSGDFLASFYKIGHTILGVLELRFCLNVMDWRGAVERRKFFQVRAERFGGRVKICNLMSAAALSCPPFNTQCKKSKNKKTKKRNSISKSDVRCALLYPPFNEMTKNKRSNPTSDVLYGVVSIQLIGLLGFYNRKYPFLPWTYKIHNFLYDLALLL